MERVTTSDGVSIAVHDFGGDGPPLVLAHATGLHGLVWGPVAERLRPSFRCVAFDHRGHGDSGLPPGLDFAWRGLAADVAAVVDGLGLERPYGVGHSAGAAALVLAEEAGPGTFLALYGYEPVIMAIPLPYAALPENPLAAGARRRRPGFASRQEAFDNYASKPPFDRARPDALWAYVEHGFADVADGTVVLKCLPENEARMFEQSSRHDAFEHLPELTCPVTLVAGAATESPLGEPNLVALASRVSRATVELMPMLSHFGPLEDPDAVVASVLRAFLGGEGGAR
jgi:pimeloyl-ACP methyl ester carboxylesterase